jgi:hypothetical protein
VVIESVDTDAAEAAALLADAMSYAKDVEAQLGAAIALAYRCFDKGARNDDEWEELRGRWKSRDPIRVCGDGPRNSPC